MRLIPPPGEIVGGHILFDGRDILKLNGEDMRKLRGGQIAMIFQNPLSSLNPVHKIKDQIAETIRLHQEGLNEKEIEQKVVEVMEKVGIPDAARRMNDYPHQYSGGMRQRVMIAMALSCNPKLLIADEPTTSLDVTIQAQILDLMKDLRREYHSSILLITHDFGVIGEFADKVAVMYSGKVVEYADVDTILEEAKHPYTEALLRSIPRLDAPSKMNLPVIRGKVPDLINPPKGCRFHPRCRYATEECSKFEPKLFEISSGHFVSCLRRGS